MKTSMKILFVAFLLSAFALIFYIAPEFDILKKNVGLFIGVTFNIISAVAFVLSAIMVREEKKKR